MVMETPSPWFRYKDRNGITTEKPVEAMILP